MLGLNKGNAEIVDFICSQQGEELFQDNSLSIHLQSENIFYDNFNTNKSFYDFYFLKKTKARK